MKNRKGIMLIEILMAIFVIAIGLLALLALLPAGVFLLRGAIKDYRTSHSAANAAALAQCQNVRQDPTVASALASPTTPITPGGTKLMFVDPIGVAGGLTVVGPVGSGGTATSGSTTQITVASAPWMQNQWTNMRVMITGGTGGTLGSSPLITTNSASVITFTPAASSALNATTTFQVMSIPRCGVSYSTTGAANMRWFTLQDDIRLGANGTPNFDDKSLPMAVRRESRYSWAYLLRQLPAVDSGTASSTTTTTLVDSTKVWAVNQWQNRTLVVGGGAPLTVSSNTATTLTFPAQAAAPTLGTYQLSSWVAEGGTSAAAPPNTTTKLVDSTKAWTINQWQNQTLVITSGPAFGGKVTIASNTATDLTLASALSVAPNASKYQILAAPANVELAVVVYQGRSTSAPDPEKIHPMDTRPLVFNAGDRSLQIPFSTERPEIQRGTWILDITNGYFYRAVDANEGFDPAAPTKKVLNVDLESPIRLASPTSANGGAKIAVMDKVVEVFERGIGR